MAAISVCFRLTQTQATKRRHCCLSLSSHQCKHDREQGEWKRAFPLHLACLGPVLAQLGINFGFIHLISVPSQNCSFHALSSDCLGFKLYFWLNQPRAKPSTILRSPLPWLQYSLMPLSSKMIASWPYDAAKCNPNNNYNTKTNLSKMSLWPVHACQWPRPRPRLIYISLGIPWLSFSSIVQPWLPYLSVFA